jgi:hypothetical protein
MPLCHLCLTAGFVCVFLFYYVCFKAMLYMYWQPNTQHKKLKKGWATRTPSKRGGEPRFSWGVTSSCLLKLCYNTSFFVISYNGLTQTYLFWFEWDSAYPREEFNRFTRVSILDIFQYSIRGFILIKTNMFELNHYMRLQKN